MQIKFIPLDNGATIENLPNDSALNKIKADKKIKKKPLITFIFNSITIFNNC